MQAELTDVLRVLNVVFGAALFGIVLLEHVVILPLVRQLPSADGVAALRFAGFRAWRLAPYCGAASELSGIAILLIWPWDEVSAAAALTLAGVALFLVAIVVTFVWYAPLDGRIRRLSVGAASAEAPSGLQQLARFHAVRFSFYSSGFVCFVLAVVLQ
jgi:hypothetical protein